MRAAATATLAAMLAAMLTRAPAQAAPADARAEENPCPLPPEPVALGSVQWNGWGKDSDNTRYQPEPALRAADVGRLALKWAFGFRGSTVAGQVTVVDGRVFVASAAGRIYSLDSRTGCTYWTFDAPAGTRSPLSIGELGVSRNQVPPRSASRKAARHKRTPAHLEILKAPSAAFFGDETGAVYALDAQKGTLLWRTQVDSQPSARIVAAPILHRDTLYVAVSSTESETSGAARSACCSFRGSLAALDMATGRVIWKTYTMAEAARSTPGGAAVDAAPTLDVKRGVLYATTEDAPGAADQPLSSAVLALDSSSGAVRWAKQLESRETAPFAGFGSSPILRTLGSGKQIILAGQRSGTVYGLDPDHAGDVLWETRIAEGTPAGGIAWGMAADYRSIYMAQSGLLAAPDNKLGSITAIDIKTGARRWYTPSPTPACTWTAECAHAQSQAVTVIPGVAFSGAMDGHLRAYSTIDGKLLWDFDTAKDFASLNAVKAAGGSLDQGGPTVVNGIVYVNSGYDGRDAHAGNVLLAFSVDGK